MMRWLLTATPCTIGARRLQMNPGSIVLTKSACEVRSSRSCWHEKLEARVGGGEEEHPKTTKCVLHSNIEAIMQVHYETPFLELAPLHPLLYASRFRNTSQLLHKVPKSHITHPNYEHLLHYHTPHSTNPSFTLLLAVLCPLTYPPSPLVEVSHTRGLRKWPLVFFNNRLLPLHLIPSRGRKNTMLAGHARTARLTTSRYAGVPRWPLLLLLLLPPLRLSLRRRERTQSQSRVTRLRHRGDNVRERRYNAFWWL